MAEPTAIQNSLRAFLAPKIPEGIKLDDPSIKLVSGGILDSVALVDLASFIESEYAVTIPEQDFHAENFDSLVSINTLIAELRSTK